MRPLIIGTRTSALALAQTHLVAAAIREAFPELTIELREIETVGDKRLDLSLGEATGKLDKGLFTKELEEALLDGRIDVAVHSLKDLPTILPVGLRLVAVLPRARVDDCLISKTPGGFAALPLGAAVATSSVRRHLQLRAARSDLEMREIRGNVGTRLRKLVLDSEWSATVLAAAGLERLGLIKNDMIEVDGTPLFVSNLTPEVTLPAVGQGAIGIETRENDGEHAIVWQTINHFPTWESVSLERALLRGLGGGCQTPLGVRSWLENAEWHLEAVLFRNGRRIVARGNAVNVLVKELLET